MKRARSSDSDSEDDAHEPNQTLQENAAWNSFVTRRHVKGKVAKNVEVFEGLSDRPARAGTPPAEPRTSESESDNPDSPHSTPEESSDEEGGAAQGGVPPPPPQSPPQIRPARAATPPAGPSGLRREALEDEPTSSSESDIPDSPHSPPEDSSDEEGGAAQGGVPPPPPQSPPTRRITRAQSREENAERSAEGNPPGQQQEISLTIRAGRYWKKVSLNRDALLRPTLLEFCAEKKLVWDGTTAKINNRAINVSQPIREMHIVDNDAINIGNPVLLFGKAEKKGKEAKEEEEAEDDEEAVDEDV